MDSTVILTLAALAVLLLAIVLCVLTIRMNERSRKLHEKWRQEDEEAARRACRGCR